MPQAAPADEVLGAEDGTDAARITADSELPPLSPSTLRSTSPTEWSTTSGSSVWEDAHPEAALHRTPSIDFVFVDDEDAN